MRLSEAHYGSRKRQRALSLGDDISAKEAIEERTREKGCELDTQEKREFMRGWRLGKSRCAIDSIEFFLRYANAKAIEEIGDLLMGIVNKYGLIDQPSKEDEDGG